MTEYLRIDLNKETWECRVCDHEIAPAAGNYKEGLLVHNRDPREIHPPILDPERYRFTFSPDPEWVRILEFCCPNCGTQVETEYAVPGHPPLQDMQVDVPALKAQWAKRGPDMLPDAGPAVVPGRGHSH
ncbi:acetone carboxylase subunit gamma [Rhizobium sp. S95]|uniref:Acetone carboxylase subunit gamma n=2 Tax=Rhizobiaceae TaxID=82115 RepID=A0AAJ1FA64_9HYPH|nr:acetone carboxylase subunit gamma [Ciceribacter sp. S95]MCO5960109.1 acetone carboxylase subunit gamma [Ciceribacter sp. S101]